MGMEWSILVQKAMIFIYLEELFQALERNAIKFGSLIPSCQLGKLSKMILHKKKKMNMIVEIVPHVQEVDMVWCIINLIIVSLFLEEEKIKLLMET